MAHQDQAVIDCRIQKKIGVRTLTVSIAKTVTETKVITDEHPEWEEAAALAASLIIDDDADNDSARLIQIVTGDADGSGAEDTDLVGLAGLTDLAEALDEPEEDVELPRLAGCAPMLGYDLTVGYDHVACEREIIDAELGRIHRSGLVDLILDLLDDDQEANRPRAAALVDLVRRLLLVQDQELARALGDYLAGELAQETPEITITSDGLIVVNAMAARQGGQVSPAYAFDENGNTVIAVGGESAARSRDQALVDPDDVVEVPQEPNQSSPLLVRSIVLLERGRDWAEDAAAEAAADAEDADAPVRPPSSDELLNNCGLTSVHRADRVAAALR